MAGIMVRLKTQIFIKGSRNNFSSPKSSDQNEFSIIIGMRKESTAFAIGLLRFSISGNILFVRYPVTIEPYENIKKETNIFTTICNTSYCINFKIIPYEL